MTLSKLTCLACLFFFANAATNIGAIDGPVRIFILAGQSNMEGQGVVAYDHPKYYNGGKGNLAWSMKNSKSAALMKHLKDASGKWTAREDVRISFKDKREVRTGKLSVGFTGYGGTSHIGPELQFGHVVGDHVDNEVLLIKTAWGGKSLYRDFRPPGSGGTVGPYYKKMLEEVRAALAALKDRKYIISGFVWFQGWNDMVDEDARAEYAANMIHLATDIRREFKAPQLPIVIGELGNLGEKASGGIVEIRKAQAGAAASPKFRKSTVAFVKTTPFARPKELSPNPGHGHHWFGNAESYFLIGDALGKAMVKLLETAKTN
ncbi:MAG: sialate O-acetylesterase [Planctomycetota bacterium]|nr:sialate O-acetylesterase [Planctomycetota bacterium]|tara:strand:+ start:172 stop:1128 length:957 start_codon:yes stop_codon:yes gene_type:complete